MRRQAAGTDCEYWMWESGNRRGAFGENNKEERDWQQS